jgi:hypothetical protein
MRILLPFLAIVLLPVVALATTTRSSASNPVVVEITDTTLSSVYYHQTNFTVPTKLVFTNLASVDAYVIFSQNTNLVEVDFPALTHTGTYVYFTGNTSLERISMPNLATIHREMYIDGNPALTQLNVCALTQIIALDFWQPPYYHIANNTPAVDAALPCFSLGGPTDFALSGNTVEENMPLGTPVGTISAESNYPSGTLTYLMQVELADNSKFHLNGTQLITNSAFDYESDDEYTVHLKVYNQLGESVEQDFTITITDVAPEPLTVVEITDATMENVYYSQYNFTTPTKLVFTNLTSVSGYVYIAQNINLVAVEFPVLTQTGKYFFCHVNPSLESLLAPNLHTIYRDLDINGNTSLTELDLCGLTEILPVAGSGIPYYTIINNTPAVDSGTPCFSLGAPTNLSLSSAIVSENVAPGFLVGTFLAETNYPSGTLTYTLDDYTSSNQYFQVSGNQLLTQSTFDYEAGHEYPIHVIVFNQLGESVAQDFTITVTDVAVEAVQTIEITDATLDNVYYHMVSFAQPTKLVFTNLTSVGGYVYFHQNVNLVEAEFPALTETGGYFYCYGNQSLTKASAPALQTVHGYLYVSHHNALTELNVCELAQILPGQEGEEPYYYIASNPLLDFDTTCLINTTITYTPANPIIIEPAPNTLIGTFSCDTTDPVTYYFVDAGGNQTTNPDFVINGNGLYLAHEYAEYADTNFTVNIAAIRVDTGAGRPDSVSDAGGLNERIDLTIAVDISDAELGTGHIGQSGAAAIWPNPASDHFTFGGTEDVTNISIHDMLGRQISGFAATGNTADVSALPAGCYIVTIGTADGKLSTAKLMIRK